MKKYRLKKEAVPFFKEKHASSIYTLDVWERMEVDIAALEEVQPLHIKYGIPIDETAEWGGGWSAEKGSHFHFTIYFPSTAYREHDKFSNHRMIRELMDKIQRNLDSFYSDFINLEDE